MSEEVTSESSISFRREEIEKQVEGYRNWVLSLQKAVNEGGLSEEDMANMVARRLVALDLTRGRANKRYEMALYDNLTGIGGRKLFNEKMEGIVKSNTPFALLIIDIDYFKKVNDEFGHPVGDQSLIGLTNILLANTRQTREGEEDSVYRLGGEEFTVILPGISSEEDLFHLAENLRKKVQSIPVVLGKNKTQKDINITISIGGGLYNGEGKDEFFKKVDERLYYSKEHGRNMTTTKDNNNE